MTLTTVVTLLGLAAAAAVAWLLGGTLGTGVIAGGLLAASATVFGLAWQRHVLRTDPARALGAMGAAFLIKLAALGLGAAGLRYVEPASARADWLGFALAFVAMAVVVLIPGTFDNARLLREKRAP